MAVRDDYSKAEVDVFSLMEKNYITYGRNLHYLELFTLQSFPFPEYLRRFLEADLQLGLTHSHDLLPSTWKLYIAIMATSCYENSYLLAILEE